MLWSAFVSLLINEFEGVTSIAVHVAVAVWSASVGKENSYLVKAFRRVREEAPKHVGIGYVGLRTSLLRVDEVGETNGVANEKDGRVVPHQVPVAFFGVKLHCEAARISRSVGAPFLSSNRRESNKHGRPLPHSLKHLRLAEPAIPTKRILAFFPNQWCWAWLRLKRPSTHAVTSFVTVNVP